MTVGSYAGGEQSVVYRLVESLCCKTETKVTLRVNCTSKKFFKIVISGDEKKGSILIKSTIFKASLCSRTNFPLKSVFNPIFPSFNECHQTTSQFMTLPGTRDRKCFGHSLYIQSQSLRISILGIILLHYCHCFRTLQVFYSTNLH